MSAFTCAALPTARVVGFAAASKAGRTVRARAAPAVVVRCAAPGPVERASAKVESANAALNTAALSAAAFMATAQPAHAGLQETGDFLVAFWKFRTENVSNFLVLTVLPILVPYVIFKILIDKKTIVQKDALTAKGYDVYFAERGLNIEILTLPQLNAFVKAMDKDLIDDEMVVEFVRQLELNEKWKSSVVNVEDPRATEIKARARAEKILEMQEKASE